jgi:gamma-glutamyltranspeptidase/glutathione hydrolase
MARDAGVPWEGLRSRGYARALMRSRLEGTPEPAPHEFSDEPAGEALPHPAPGASGLTSQMAAIDADGNAVSLTQTVLNAFGARVLDPGTGVLLNNGIGYFDPRPGSPHSVAPGAVAFSAMTPLVLCDRDRGPVAAVGASGGRRIISGVARIVAALARGRASLQEACEGPWIHAEHDAVVLDVRWPEGTAEGLAASGYAVEPAEDTPTVGNFARPNGVIIGSDGKRRSGLDPTKPGGAAVA